MTRRTERIGEQVRAEIARILREEVTDPRIGLVTLTRVDVAPDLSHALVWWSALEPGSGPEAEAGEAGARAARREETARGLESAAGFVRRQLAAVLPLRRVPELRFRHDPSLELGDRTLALLREVEEEGPHGPA